MSDPIVSAPTRWCEICLRPEACHCPAMKSYCDICVPPVSPAARNAVAAFVAELPAQSEYAKALGAPAPTPARLSLVLRWSA